MLGSDRLLHYRSPAFGKRVREFRDSLDGFPL